MNINNIFGHVQLCTNDYFYQNHFLKRGVIFVFPYSLAWKKDEVDHLCGISYNGEFVGVLKSIFAIF